MQLHPRIDKTSFWRQPWQLYGKKLLVLLLMLECFQLSLMKHVTTAVLNRCQFVDSVTRSVAERFLGFVPLQQLSAEVLSSTIIQFLVDVGLSVNCCVAQSYDEAAVMAGVTNEVQKVIRDAAANPCPYVHCHSHRLNLVLVDVSKQLDFVGNTCTWFTLISGHPSAADRAQNSESMPAEDQSSITEPCNQDSDKPMLYLVCIISCCYD